MTPYQILEITPEATWEEIRKSWKKLVLKWHPDKNLGNEEAATKKFKEINNAYKQLYKEKFGSDEEDNSESIPDNLQDMLDEIFSEHGFVDPAGFFKYFLDLSKELAIENIKNQMIGIEQEIETDPNFWSRFGRDWEQKINEEDETDKILNFQGEMFEALKKINGDKLAKERAKHDEFIENSDKGLEFIKNYLRSKNLSNAKFNSWIKEYSSPPMTKKNWHEQPINWGHEDSINTYTYMIDSCANEEQISLDRQRSNWKRKQGGDSYSRALFITEINDYWGSGTTTINGKKLEEIIGSDWKSQINNSKGQDIKKKKDHFKKMIDQAKQTDQNTPREYLPYILGGVGIVAVIGLIIVLVTNKRRR